MFNLTVEDASKRLGVGRARVNQLIRSGMLAAEKVGGIVPAKGMWGATC